MCCLLGFPIAFMWWPVAIAATCSISCHQLLLCSQPLQVPEKMAMIQKAMVSTCAILGKPSIITRVVDTMIRTPRPTR